MTKLSLVLKPHWRHQPHSNQTDQAAERLANYCSRPCLLSPFVDLEKQANQGVKNDNARL